MTTTHPTPTLFAVPHLRVAELAWEPFPGSSRVSHKVLYTAPDSVAGLLRLEPDAHEVTHVHLHGEHHLWVISGAVVVDGTELVAGSYLHVPARLQHALEDTGIGSTLFYVFCTTDE